jgi:hypothetical protein
MELALCPAASVVEVVEADEMATASMVSVVLDDNEAMSLEDRDEGEEAIPAHEGYPSKTSFSKEKAIVAKGVTTETTTGSTELWVHTVVP